MKARPIIPPIDDADCLPHDKAVWREYRPRKSGANDEGRAAHGTHDQRVSIDLGDGLIECGIGQALDWKGVKRWRYGWPPRRDR